MTDTRDLDVARGSQREFERGRRSVVEGGGTLTILKHQVGAI